MTITVRVTVDSDDAEFLVEERVEVKPGASTIEPVRAAVARATNKALLAYGVRRQP